MGILRLLDELDKKYSRRIHYMDFGPLNKVIYFLARFFNPENLASIYCTIFFLSNKNFFYLMIYLEGAALSLLLRTPGNSDPPHVHDDGTAFACSRMPHAAKLYTRGIVC